MADIPATYAGAWMRWALYLHDHPAAAEPTFDICFGEDQRVNVPSEFAPTSKNGEKQQYVVCTLDPRDGSRPEVAWKDIPFQVKSYGSWVDFAKTPENWRKVSASALGRALKEAGYPDDTRELHAVVTWRRRDIELRALAAGAPVDAITPAPDADITTAGRTDDDEHPDEAAAQDDTQDAEVVGEVVAWAPETAAVLRELMESLPTEGQDAVRAFCEQRNLGPYWLVTNGKLRQVSAYARSQRPKAPPPDAVPGPEAEAAADSPSPAPEAAPGVPDGQSGESCVGCGEPIDPKAKKGGYQRATVTPDDEPWHAKCVPFEDDAAPETLGDLIRG